LLDVHPVEHWERAVRAAFERIKEVSFVSDVDIHIYPEMDYPIPGLNPDIEIEGRRAPTDPETRIADSSGALWNRERKGCALIEFTLNQPGFSKFDEYNPKNSQISPNFRINMWFPRDYPSQGVGHGFLFVEEDGFKYPHYPNIMRRRVGFPYWENTNSVAKTRLLQPFPEGAMCLHALNNRTPIDEVLLRIKQYLSVAPEYFEGGVRNDKGFDYELFELYMKNKDLLARMISEYNPGRPVNPQPTPAPPPPPPARKKKGNNPPPPPPPARKRR